MEEATREINVLGRAVLNEQHPETYDPNTQFRVVSLHDDLTRGVRPALVAILGAVLLVLVIACVNVTNLLLARAVQRHGEFALRAALGAGRSRLIRQLLTESLLLAALVVAEVALAIVLLVSSGLLLRSMERLFAVPVGFDAVGLLTSQLPMSGDRDEYGAHFEASPTQAAETYGVFRYIVRPGYLETMRIPLRRGRLLDERDSQGAPLVVLISEPLADSRFPSRDPIGQRLRIGPSGPFTIVGVVGNVKQMSLAISESDAVYINAPQSWFADSTMSLVVRVRGDAAAFAPAVRQAVWSVDKDQPVVRIATMDDLLAASAAERRFALILFEAFALAALVLAAAGIYGVLAGSVAERTREIGVRSALGASRGNILALVVRQAMTLTVLGAIVGLVGAIAASEAIVTLLFGVSRLDPVTYVAVIALLLSVSAAACWIPAWRAARVDPAVTLRAE